MKILVTGAGGFIGAAVVAEALRSGHEVIGTIRPGGDDGRLSNLKSKFNLISVDLRDTALVASVMREYRAEVIVHAAWSGVNNKSRSDNLQITDNIATSCHLLEAGANHGASKFVGLGSQGEYGPFERKIKETDLPRPTTLYGASKLAVHYLTQQLADRAGISYAWVRIFSTYGPGDNPHWLIPMLVNQMLNGQRPKTTLGKQFWDYVFIDDLARAVVSIATQPAAKGVFNLGSGQPVQVRSIVEKIRDLTATKLELIFGEIPYRPDQVWYMEADISRLKTVTGWSPEVDINAGLATTVQWHREQLLARAPTLADHGLEGGGHA
jgi:UDP-glucose 4-epimerase